MKLLRLKLRHFRSHRNTTLHFQRLTFIRGLNRTGKSGIRLGIEIALSGRNEVTDEGGKGYEELIEEGAPFATVELEFEEYAISVKLDRNAGRTFKVVFPNSTTIIGTHAQGWIAENVAAPDIVNACLNATRFFGMNVNQQAELLAHVLLPATLEIDPAVGEWLRANNLSVVMKSSLFATIEATHKLIANARTDVNRKIRDLKNIEEPEIPALTREAVKADVNALRADEGILLDRISAARESITATERDNGQLTALDHQIAEQQQRMTNAPALLSPDERTKLLTVANKAQEHYDLNGYLTAYQTHVDGITQTLEELFNATEGGTCPTCSTPLTPEMRAAILAPMQMKRNELNAKIRDIQHKFKTDGNPADANQRLQSDSDANSTRMRIADALDHLQTTRQATEQRITDRQLPPETGDGSVEQLEAALADVKQRIVKGLDVLVKAVELEDRHNEYKRQVAARAAAEVRHAELEKLLDHFGPAGIKAKLIAERLDIFTSKVNAVLKYWNYEMQFNIEPFLIRIHEFDTVITLSPRQLSASEKYRLGVAFAVAIAQWTNFNMLICDGAEILDKVDKWQLAQALLQSDIEQAIVCSTGIAGTFTAAGTAFYTLSKDAGITEYQLDEETQETEAVAH